MVNSAVFTQNPNPFLVVRPSEDVCAIVLSSRGAVTDKVPGRDRSEQTKTTDNINEVNKNKTKQNKTKTTKELSAQGRKDLPYPGEVCRLYFQTRAVSRLQAFLFFCKYLTKVNKTHVRTTLPGP